MKRIRRPPLCALLFLFSLASCVSSAPPPADSGVLESVAVPSRLVPGAHFCVAVRNLPAEAAAELRATLEDGAGKPLASAPFFPLDEEPTAKRIYVAILAVPPDTQVLPLSVRIAQDQSPEGPPAWYLPLEILPREFHTDTLNLNRRNSAIRTDSSPQRLRESALLQEILARANPNARYDTGPFALPLSSTRRTSSFASRRVYRYASGDEDVSWHAGIDFGVPKGTAITASARGRVVLSAFRIVSGNSVIVEHLPGIYTLYYHLDSLAVAEGETVERGQLLGRSGSTGLSTGPHLHWELRIAGVAADPDEAVVRPLLDKGLILDKMTAKYGR